jgi:hypothetical protein
VAIASDIQLVTRMSGGSVTASIAPKPMDGGEPIEWGGGAIDLLKVHVKA